jgi:hypothetical protein
MQQTRVARCSGIVGGCRSRQGWVVVPWWNPLETGFSGGVFMSEQVLVGAPAEQARRRLFAQVRRDGLHGAVADAFADSNEPPSSAALPVPHQALTVHTLPSYRSGAVTVIPLRWYTTSDFDDRFPAVDANLELEQAEPGTSRLRLTGIYRSPPGQPATTRQQDQTRATIRHFLTRLADILAPGAYDEGHERDSHEPSHAARHPVIDAVIPDTTHDFVSLDERRGRGTEASCMVFS